MKRTAAHSVNSDFDPELETRRMLEIVARWSNVASLRLQVKAQAARGPFRGPGSKKIAQTALVAAQSQMDGFAVVTAELDLLLKDCQVKGAKPRPKRKVRPFPSQPRDDWTNEDAAD